MRGERALQRSAILKFLRVGLGIALIAYAIWFFIFDLPRVNIIGPLFVVVIALWLIVGPKKVSVRRKQRKARFQAFLDANPDTKKLENWSNRLGWGGWPLGAAWIYYVISYLSASLSVSWGLAVIFAGVFLIQMPSFILSGIVIMRFYQDARTKLEKKNAP